MAYVVGMVVALLVSVFAAVVGLDRDRAFCPTVLSVVGTYYVLFAVMGGSGQILIVECVIVTAFLLLAALGFRGSLWVTAAGLVGHGVLDGFHQGLVPNQGVPVWWPAFCGAFDVTAGLILAWLLLRSQRVIPARLRSESH
jgi:hypothetical protein